MEYIEQDLDMILNSTQTLNEYNLVKVVYNSLCSLAFIHESNIMHRDIKPSNILIDSRYNVKITDLGFSRTIVP